MGGLLVCWSVDGGSGPAGGAGEAGAVGGGTLVGALGSGRVAGRPDDQAALAPGPDAGLAHGEPFVEQGSGQVELAVADGGDDEGALQGSRWACEPPKRARVVRIGASWRRRRRSALRRTRGLPGTAGRPISAVMETLDDRRGGGDVALEPGDDGAGVGEPAGAGEGHDGVQVVERVPRLVGGAGGPRFGEWGESAAGVDVVEVQTPQQGAGVEHLQRDTGGPFVVDVPVVDRQRLVAAAGFEQVEGEVPPVVNGEQVAVAPVGLPGAEEADARRRSGPASRTRG